MHYVIKTRINKEGKVLTTWCLWKHLRKGISEHSLKRSSVAHKNSTSLKIASISISLSRIFLNVLLIDLIS